MTMSGKLLLCLKTDSAPVIFKLFKSDVDKIPAASYKPPQTVIPQAKILGTKHAYLP